MVINYSIYHIATSQQENRRLRLMRLQAKYGHLNCRFIFFESLYGLAQGHTVQPIRRELGSCSLRPSSARERTTMSCLCLSILAHHQSTTTLPHTNTSLYALQPTQLLLPLLQSPQNPLFPQPSGLADRRSIIRRPTTIAAHCLRLLIPPAINATGTSHEHTIY
jgi:hypothetical protein